MKTADYARLLLAAIWGASFIFMRVAAPAFGTAWTAEGRLLIAGLVLAAWLHFAGFDPQWRRYWRPYAAIGLVNLTLPSLFYAFALRHIPASVGAVLNSTAPMFGALLAALFLGERFTIRKAAAALMLLPLAAFSPPAAAIGALEISNLLALALFGGALGFVMYFRLISDVGATRALTVTYLMPLFGLLWGMLFLGESLPASALAGGVLILSGTVLVTRG